MRRLASVLAQLLRPAAARTRSSFVAVPAVLGLALGVSGIRAGNRATGGGVPPLPDTIVVYGPRQLTSPTGSPANHVEAFTVTVHPGRTYVLKVDNGASDGSLRVSGGSVVLNGTEVLGSATLAAGGPGWTREVTALTDDTLRVTVQGPAGAYLTVSLLSVSDPTFVVFGLERFTRTAGPPNEFIRQFTVSATAAAPHRMCVINGNANGTNRLSSARIWLNGIEVLHPSDLNQNVARVDRTVTLQAQNTVTIRLTSNPGGFLDLCFTATDVTPPVITVNPGPGHVTRDSTVIVSGTVQDETPVELRINGAPTPLGAGNSYSAVVPLPSQGPNTIHVVATDAAGLSTDSVRVVIRDSDAPLLNVTAPPQGLITRDDSVTVTGSVADSSAVTVNANGVPLPLDSLGNFTGRLPLAEGVNFITVTATDAVGNSASVPRQVTRDITPPVLTLGAPAEGFLTRYDTITVTGSVFDASPVTVSANGVPLPVDAAGQFAGVVPLVEGGNIITVTATDAATNSATAARTGTRDSQAPVITIAAPAEGATTQATTIAVSGTVTDASAVTLTVNALSIAVAAGGAFEGEVPVVLGANTLTFVATDAATNSSTATRSVTRLAAGPPDPAVIATQVVATEASLLETTMSFLYSGANPVQTGVAPGTIGVVRAAALRGRVISRDSQPLGGVEVTIAGHPELGRTETRADGRFDMAVNGGLTLVANFAKGGYLPVQRRLEVPWQTFTLPDDVVLIQPDTVVTFVDLTSNQVQVAQASVQTDLDGPRQATVLFEPGTQATLVRSDGTTQPLTTLAIRATEFTVGDNGPAAMPAPLPPTSHYTYAVQVTADEALADGAGAVVTFSQPVPLYVQNFLSIPVGTPVPVGSYDAAQQRWVPENNGVVLKILARDSTGRALLDINGDGIADTDSVLLFNYGIDPLELVQLGGTFNPGDELWRTQITRTFPYDLNYGFSIVGGTPPAVDVRGPCGARGADLLRCSLQVQTAFQRVGIVGSPFTLNYASDRTRGNAADRQLQFQLIDSVVPPSLVRVDLQIDVAGRRFGGSFTPSADLAFTFTWDGLDAYGRTLQASQPVVARVGYVYPIAYAVPASAAQSFGLTCTTNTPTGPQCILPADVRTPARQTTTVWQTLPTTVGGMDAAGQGLGGFTFDVQHAYDPIGGVLFAGDGTRRATGSLPEQITRFAGLGVGSNLNDTTQLLSGVSALSPHSRVARPTGVAFGSDGSVYFTDANTHRVRRVLNGIITTVAGSGSITFGAFSGDGGPGTSARLNQPIGLGIGPDGSLYFVDRGNLRIRKVDPSGIITTVAGTGQGCSQPTGPCGDGGPALQGTFVNPNGLAVGPDGSVYVADEGMHRIRQILPDGTIRTAVGQNDICQNRGNGYARDCGEGIPGPSVKLRSPRAVAVGPDGSVYFSTQAFNYNERVRRMTPDGLVRTVAGSDAPVSFLGDGGPALQATLRDIWSIGVGPDGTLYVAEEGNEQPPHVRVRRVRPDGFITTAVGDGIRFTTPASTGNNGPALRARIGRVQGLGVGPDGFLYLADDNQVRRVSAPLPGLLAGTTVIASEDGSELYVFSPAGRILLTLDAITGDTISVFSYSSARQLIAIRDRDGRLTQIQRDSNGRVAETVAPNGQRTAVTLDANGNIAALIGPDGRSLTYALSASGLLTSVSDQAGRVVERNTFDAAGRLAVATNPLGGATTLSFSETSTGSRSDVSTPAGQSLATLFTSLPTGAQHISAGLTGGGTVRDSIFPDGRRLGIAADGTRLTQIESPDPRLGSQAPVIETIVQLPSGLAMTMRLRRGVVVDDPDDPFSVATQTDSLIVNGRVSTVVHDNLAQTVTRRSAAGRAILAELDGAGRVTGTTVAGRASARATYDVLGRLATVSQGGRTQVFGYDAEDRVTSLTDALGRAEQFVYDAANRLRDRILPDGSRIRYGYDTTGNLASLTPPGRAAHRMTYNPAGQLESYSAPDAGTGPSMVSAAYDSAGRITRLTRPDGSVLSVVYAPVGEGVRLAGLAGDTVAFETDTVTRNLLRILRPRGVNVAFSYDGGLRTGVTWTGDVSGSLAYTYDVDFRPQSERVNGAHEVQLAYDADGLMTQVGALALTRDAQNGAIVGTTLGGTQTSAAYTAHGELDSLGATFGGTTLYSARFGYDALGRIVTRTELIGATTTVFSLGYDSVGSLVSVTRDGVPIEQYEYDANGNRSRAVTPAGVVTATVDAQDRLVAYGDATYAYTLMGELARHATGPDTTTFEYDSWGQSHTVRLPGGTVIEYVLDGQGRRVGRRVNGLLTRAWLYRGPLAIVAELDGAGGVVSRFVYGERPNVPEYMIRGGQTYRLVLDERNSVRLVVDAATGATAQRIDYDAFGRVTLNTNPGFQPFAFAGGLYDELTGLVRFGARDYDPTVGRWTTRDPLLFDGGDANLYRYAGGDPVNSADPFGEYETLTSQELASELEAELRRAQDARNVKKIRDLTRTLCHRAAQVAKPFSRLERWGWPFERNHVVRNADMADLALAGYTRGLGIAIPLMGGNALGLGTHFQVTRYQNRFAGKHSPMELARRSLRVAGCSRDDINTIMRVVEAANEVRGWVVP